MKKITRILCLTAFFLSTVQAAFAGGDGLTITEAWARPTILADRPGAAYFTIRNDTEQADRLIRVASPLAARIELHLHKNDGGVMRMTRVADIPVAAHSTLQVKPGGYHLMIFGLTKKLRLEDDLPLTVTFEHAGDVEVTARVRKKAPVMGMDNHQAGHKH